MDDSSNTNNNTTFLNTWLPQATAQSIHREATATTTTAATATTQTTFMKVKHIRTQCH
jgi:hypothetical protein